MYGSINLLSFIELPLLSINKEKSRTGWKISEKNWKHQDSNPGQLGYGAQMLPLCYVTPWPRSKKSLSVFLFVPALSISLVVSREPQKLSLWLRIISWKKFSRSEDFSVSVDFSKNRIEPNQFFFIVRQKRFEKLQFEKSKKMKANCLSTFFSKQIRTITIIGLTFNTCVLKAQ